MLIYYGNKLMPSCNFFSDRISPKLIFSNIFSLLYNNSKQIEKLFIGMAF